MVCCRQGTLFQGAGLPQGLSFLNKHKHIFLFREMHRLGNECDWMVETLEVESLHDLSLCFAHDFAPVYYTETENQAL